MPPKAKITREMIIDAAFEITRNAGIEAVNARTVSQRLQCSTQPVMYYFKTIGELKRAVYERSDKYHSAFLAQIGSDDSMKEIGLRYIRFAAEEKNLFRFLFQSNEFSGKSIAQLTDAGELQPVISLLGRETAGDTAQAKTIFRLLFLFAHGYASMYANNEMEYDEQTILQDLERIFKGITNTTGGTF